MVSFLFGGFKFGGFLELGLVGFLFLSGRDFVLESFQSLIKTSF